MSASVWEPGANLVVVDAESTNLSQVFIATLAQTGFTLTDFSYTVSTGSIAVYRGGQRLILGTDWSETSSTSITLLGISLEAGEVIEVVAVLGSASVSAIAAAQSAANAAQSAIDAANAALSLDPSSFPSSVTHADTVPVVNGTGTGWLYKTLAQFKTYLGLGTAAFTDSNAYQAADADIPTVSASQAEMESGSEAALRSMSPLRVKQAIAANAVGGVTSVNGNVGAITAAQIATAATAGYGYTPANVSHSHSYAGMNAVVAIVSAHLDSGHTCTRADGSTFTFTTTSGV